MTYPKIAITGHTQQQHPACLAHQSRDGSENKSAAPPTLASSLSTSSIPSLSFTHHGNVLSPVGPAKRYVVVVVRLQEVGHFVRHAQQAAAQVQTRHHQDEDCGRRQTGSRPARVVDHQHQSVADYADNSDHRQRGHDHKVSLPLLVV